MALSYFHNRRYSRCYIHCGFIFLYAVYVWIREIAGRYYCNRKRGCLLGFVLCLSTASALGKDTGTDFDSTIFVGGT